MPLTNYWNTFDSESTEIILVLKSIRTNSTQMEFIISNKNTKLFVLNNYHFHKLTEGKVSTTWRCVYYKKFKCNATATTVDDQLTSVRNEHNHNLTIGKAEAKTFQSQVKANAQEKTATVAIADIDRY